LLIGILAQLAEFVNFEYKSKEDIVSKKPDWFKGIFPALVTPFTEDDQVDEEGGSAGGYYRRVRVPIGGGEAAGD
jgi:hypothetical protein